MATIHPRPRLAALRDDGDGGLDLLVHTAGGGTEVYPLRPADAARWLAQLSDFIGRRLREREGT